MRDTDSERRERTDCRWDTRSTSTEQCAIQKTGSTTKSNLTLGCKDTMKLHAVPYSTYVRRHGLDVIVSGCILNHLEEHSFRNTHTFHPERWRKTICNLLFNMESKTKLYPSLQRDTTPIGTDDATIVVRLSNQILHPTTLRLTPSEEGHERSTPDGGTRLQRKRNCMVVIIGRL